MSLVSDGSFWTVAPIDTPHVETRITLDYTIANHSLRAFTQSGTNRFSKTSVPLFCSLVLFCMGNQPFQWIKNGKSIQDRYHGTVHFKSVSLDAIGTYVCAMNVSGTNSATDRLNTTIELDVHSPAPTINSTEPQILTSWFEDTYYRVGYTYSFDFIGFKTPEFNFSHNIRQYVIFPTNITVAINGPSYNGISVKSNFESRDNEYLWRTSLNMLTTYDHAGTYTFVIEYVSSNGSWTKLFRHLNLIPMKYKYSLAERPLADEFRAYLMVGRYYKLTFWTVYVEPIIQSEIEAFSQSSTKRRDCGYNRVLARSVYDECGVISVIKKTLTQSAHVNAVDINLRATGSCSFRVRIWSPGNTVVQNITTYINVTAIEETYSDREFSDKETERTIIVAIPGGERDRTDAYANDSLTLRCLVPTCDWELIGWCKQRTTKSCAWLLWKNDTIEYEGIVADDPSIRVSFVRLNNFTVAFDMRIDSLRRNQTGDYGCGTYKPVHKPRRLGETFRKWLTYAEYQFSLPFVTFGLHVLEPMAPYFPGNETTTVSGEALREALMKRGDTTDLSCPIDGSPKPSITWRRSIDPNAKIEGFEQRSEYLPAMRTTNKTIISIDRIGFYECIAQNRYGTNRRRFKVSYDSVVQPLPIVLSVLAAASVISLTIGLMVWLRRRANAAVFKELARTLNERPQGIIELDANRPLNEQTDILAYDPRYEIARERFKLAKMIGGGEYGHVFRGELRTGDNIRYVAVKTPKDVLNDVQYKALIAELKIMCHIPSHVNVLSLVGACTAAVENRQLFVLTEYCEKGSLLSYLSDHIVDYEGNMGDPSEYGMQSLLEFAYQAANGMKHLAASRIIHRDLAVRNLLLTNRRLIKIADFGLSRHKETVYKFLDRNVRLPIAWMAPESVINLEYTHKSDVWSFGIVLWEIFRCARMPYSDVDINHSVEIIYWLRAGNRLSMPMLATSEIYSLMLDCWDANPSMRPTFSECRCRIARHLEERFPSNYASLTFLLLDAFRKMTTNAAAGVNERGTEEVAAEQHTDAPVSEASTDADSGVPNPQELPAVIMEAEEKWNCMALGYNSSANGYVGHMGSSPI